MLAAAVIPAEVWTFIIVLGLIIGIFRDEGGRA